MSTKKIQGKLWSSAPSYWTNHFEPSFLPLYRKVLEHLKPTSKHLLLDAGCGSGLFSNMAIKTGAQVVGIDAAPGLLEVARRRNAKNNFLEEDLEDLPFGDESFHFVVGCNSFQYASNFDNAIVEAARVLKRGGQLVIAIWDKPALSDATDILKALNTLLPAPPPDSPGPFALSEDGTVEAACENAGLRLAHKFTVPCSFIYANRDEAIKSFIGTAPGAMAINNTSIDVVERVLNDALEPFRCADDIHFLLNQFMVFIGTK